MWNLWEAAGQSSGRRPEFLSTLLSRWLRLRFAVSGRFSLADCVFLLSHEAGIGGISLQGNAINAVLQGPSSTST